jgi:hypothetical protein
MTIMSDACAINALKEHNWWQIDNSKSVIDDSRVMLHLVELFMIIIYDCHLQLSCSYSTGHMLQRLTRDKHSSIFGEVVSDEEEKGFMTFPLGEHLKRAFEVCPSVRKNHQWSHSRFWDWSSSSIITVPLRVVWSKTVWPTDILSTINWPTVICPSPCWKVLLTTPRHSA